MGAPKADYYSIVVNETSNLPNFQRWCQMFFLGIGDADTLYGTALAACGELGNFPYLRKFLLAGKGIDPGLIKGVCAETQGKFPNFAKALLFLLS